jgi:hypothetical protein
MVGPNQSHLQNQEQMLLEDSVGDGFGLPT